MAIRQPKPARERILVSKYHGRRMTEDEYLALPDEKPYLEYVDGVVLQKPMRDDLHRKLIWFFDHIFYVYARSQGGGSGGPEGRARLTRTGGYRLPDTAFWVKGRPSGKGSLPSLVIEIRSERQPLGDLRAKCRAFLANGVDACWLVEPYERWVEVFDEDLDGARLTPDEALENAAMPGFTVTQAELFAELDR